ncbi:variant erythrocyte surface antigen-1 family protein [Babesia caballi]|uniref:Variant erythrocyte surface antigen-1 family protein n=1 Tax=Babesia caballi TaxID=5871 RepID=A0AAV4LR82_BABCB|nr:variant erythrocyte surface antigen-1 family protein [Babesia caballi]
MGAPKTQLTDWPENLKEVIDWFLRVGGKDGGRDFKRQLMEAIKRLENFDAPSGGLKEAESVEGLFGHVANGLMEFVGYKGSGGGEITSNGIGSVSYTSSYSTQATWSESSSDPTTCAHIFLGSMPILYFGLTYTYWKCSKTQNGLWAAEKLNVGGHSPLYLFMLHMGFKPSGELLNITGSEVAERLKKNFTYGFHELKNARTEQYSYSIFLANIKQKYGKDTLTSNPTNCALYALQRASTFYLTSQFQKQKGEESDGNLNAIKTSLLKFKKETKNYYDLETEVAAFLHEINVLLSSSSHSGGMSAADSPSTAGPVAGTLITLGLGGGAAGAYLFNLGGAKTLVNGLLRIG